MPITDIQTVDAQPMQTPGVPPVETFPPGTMYVAFSTYEDNKWKPEGWIAWDGSKYIHEFPLVSPGWVEDYLLTKEIQTRNGRFRSDTPKEWLESLGVMFKNMNLMASPMRMV